MKKLFEIKHEGTVIRIEIPQVNEDFLLLLSLTVIFCTAINAIAAAV